MKYAFVMLLVVFLSMFSCDEGVEVFKKPHEDKNKEENVVTYHLRAKEIYDLIIVHYKAGQLFKENFPMQVGDATYSYLWPYDAYVSGALLLNKLGYNVNLVEVVSRYDKYMTSGAHGNSIEAYSSSTDGASGRGTRFYDDNSIVGISLLEAYEQTENKEFIRSSDVIYNFIKSGIDDKLGGALWWNEDYKYNNQLDEANKPACSNGYATLFLLSYYDFCEKEQKEEVLCLAQELYDWLRDNLYDDRTKCYWNDKGAEGAVNTRLWTYNTAVMVQNGLKLYKITGKQSYLNQAKETARGSYDNFVKYSNGILSYPGHDPWFNTKLLLAYIDLLEYDSNADGYIQTYMRFINRGYDRARTTQGFFYEDWTGANQGRYYSLLMQAAVVESYSAIALYKEEKLGKK